jgi:hypothetical protein
MLARRKREQQQQQQLIKHDLMVVRRLQVRETHLKQSAVGRELGWNGESLSFFTLPLLQREI